MVANCQEEKWISVNMYNDWLNEMPLEKAFIRMCLFLRVLGKNWSSFRIFEIHKGEIKSEYAWPHLDSNTWRTIEQEMETELMNSFKKEVDFQLWKLPPKEFIPALIVAKDALTVVEGLILGKISKRWRRRSQSGRGEVSRSKNPNFINSIWSSITCVSSESLRKVFVIFHYILGPDYT